jgi:amidase
MKAYLNRIEEVNTRGPELRAVIEINAAALEQAKECDGQRKKEKQARNASESESTTDYKPKLGSLHGIPILLKDNIATKSPPGYEENMNTTSGSLALVGCYPSIDAAVTRKLRESGAIIIGKSSLSEWAAWRADPNKIPSGWSSYGGQCYSPYYPKANPSGSSSGSGVAAAIGLAAGTLGSETDGSITFPSSRCNIVGLKPTVGLTSRTGGTSRHCQSQPFIHFSSVIPISKTQDSVGPMCRTVSDVAAILQVIAGSDQHDPSTKDQPSIPDYRSVLRRDYIKGRRLGVLRSIYCQKSAWEKDSEATVAVILEAFDAAIQTLRGLGADIVENVVIPTAEEIFGNGFAHEGRIFDAEMKVSRYVCKTSPITPPIQNLFFSSIHPATIP